MESLFLNKYRTTSSATRAQMISEAKNYVGDQSFLNLLVNLDVNDIDPKNKHRPSSIYFVASQMLAFRDMPRFQAEVKEWLGKF
jgi:hypothetical protein